MANRIVRTSNLLFSCRVSCRGVNASRFFMIMDFSSYLFFFLFLWDTTLCHAIYARSLCREERSVGFLNSFRSFFQFDTNAYSPCEWAGLFLWIPTYSTSIDSLFEHLFKAYQWQSIAQTTARQNEFNENMRIHFLHYFGDLWKLIISKSLWIFFSTFKALPFMPVFEYGTLERSQRREWEKRMPHWKWICDNTGCG